MTGWHTCVLDQGAWVQVQVVLPVPASCCCTPREPAGDGSSRWIPTWTEYLASSFGPSQELVQAFGEAASGSVCL